MKCEHEDFTADVGVHRLTDNTGKVTSYMAEVRVACTICGKRFQFLGLEPGLDLAGARVSLDGLEASIAMSPEGEKPSPFAKMAYNIKAHT